MSKSVIAKLHPVDFSFSDSNFNSLTVFDDEVFYTLSSHDLNVHGRAFRYNTKTGETKLFADLGEVTGETGKKSIPQGKSHAPFFRIGDKIYFATHISYAPMDASGKERPSEPPAGYQPYPGGKLVEYCTVTGEFRVLFSAGIGEGLQTMQIDTKRSIAYCIVWPTGEFLVYDINSETLYNRGHNSRGGEKGKGDQYSCLCRTIAVDPRDGAAYYTNYDGQILEYRHEIGIVKPVEWTHLRRDIFGKWDLLAGGHDGYNWRHMVWNEKYQKFYGVHGKSAHLFSFDPVKKELDVVARIAGEYCLKNGYYEVFRYGYLTLGLKPGDDDTLYYITGYYDLTEEQIKQKLNGTLVINSDAHNDNRLLLTVVTYHIPTNTYKDHGIITTEDGRTPYNTQSIGIDKSGRIYTCPWISDKTNPKGFTSQLISIEL